MNELKLTEALLDDQRAVSDTLRQQLEDLREERNALNDVRERALAFVRQSYHHDGLHYCYARPLLEILDVKKVF